jgi:uncharacterized protein YkwD
MRRLILSCLFTALCSAGIKTYAQQTGTPEFKHEFLKQINHVRSTGCTCGTTYMAPAPPLVWNDNLEKSAQGHAWDMSNNNYFSHTSKDGRTMEDRIVFAGYFFKGFKSFAIGENIAFGQNSITEVMNGWIKSPGHCKNLLNPQFKEIGVAENHTYWVQDFGGRESFTLEQQREIKSGQLKLMSASSGSGH